VSLEEAKEPIIEKPIGEMIKQITDNPMVEMFRKSDIFNED